MARGALSAHWLVDRLRSFGAAEAMVWRGRRVGYGGLVAGVEELDRELAARGVEAGASVALVGDYSPATCQLLLALIARRCVAVPLTPQVLARHPEFLDIAEVTAVFHFDDETDSRRFETRPAPGAATHPLLAELRAAGEAGLVLFSSGSTGAPKASLLSFERLLERFREGSGKPLRTLVFLLLDHIGGINTLMHILTSGGTAVSIAEREPRAVAAAIAEHRIQLLPTTPTFLNMLLISGAHREHDLSSLELVTYGTEPMPESTLRHLNEELPGARFKQTYGLSELGILSTRSRDSDSLWVKVGGEGYETRVVDGILHIRARSAMLGYLNAPSPFDAEGWFDTRDAVEVDGEYLRILGRTSEIINVGGEKVYPAQVESVLMEMEGVRDAVAYGKPNAVMGQVVAARLALEDGAEEEPAALRRRVRAHCQGRLAPYQVPAVVAVDPTPHHGERFKKMRRRAADGAE